MVQAASGFEGAGIRVKGVLVVAQPVPPSLDALSKCIRISLLLEANVADMLLLELLILLHITSLTCGALRLLASPLVTDRMGMVGVEPNGSRNLVRFWALCSMSKMGFEGLAVLRMALLHFKPSSRWVWQ